ncbi:MULTISPECIES: hypothetical protein [unclassified Methanosarcina]|uniref:hypothetical protein n=1 Tax=unclassified Methanosarcina TaxID=2644672 RepID=UPI000615825A|nr:MULTISPECIES: hypothetical protein [unclassified Methanosarcina]AKB19217.1 hypothetical protein MSWHS_2354 [Methanosarcina sp. WWM596]AKB22953.1 hypothetical protein MSWH1_2682 [Methanosarcina sp. WH1]
MNTKNTLVGILFLFFVVGGALTFMDGKAADPVTIYSEGQWDARVLNNSYLANKSDVIVIGEVKEILSGKWTTVDGKRPTIVYDERIYTDVIIGVEEYLKNPQPSEEITVRVMGGKVGEDRVIVTDEAEFEPGKKVLLFLTTEDPFTKNLGGEHFRVTSWAHGKFEIVDDHAIRPKVMEEYQNISLRELREVIQESK